MNKTATILATFTARYGKLQPKDGQELQAVAQSYETALGGYHVTDLFAACSEWMATSKWPRWPEPAELLEILRSFGAKPEAKNRIEMSPRTRDAANDASRWYQGLLARPLPEVAGCISWADALNDIIGVGKPEHFGKTFAWLLTHAWLNGVIPADFEQKAEAYFVRMNERKSAYRDAVKLHGALAVHEGRV